VADDNVIPDSVENSTGEQPVRIGFTGDFILKQGRIIAVLPGLGC
jgi:hypothetical protein